MPHTFRVAPHDLVNVRKSPVLQKNKLITPAPPPKPDEQGRIVPSDKTQPVGNAHVCAQDTPIAHSQDYATPKIPSDHGFVRALCDAYNHHHHLVIRPDDVWIAIMTQFVTYLDAHAEELRARFVNHKGQKQLEVNSDGTLLTADYVGLCSSMIDQISSHIKDPKVRDWAIPSFTTSTTIDKMAGAIILMAGMKEYFRYKFSLLCGIPLVTLEGTVEDWENIEQRASQLTLYDNKDKYMTQWYALLSPVLAEFTQSVRGKPNLEWWQKVCSRHGSGSGPRYLSGWVTTFCVFSDGGKWAASEPDDAEPTPWLYIDTNDLPNGCVKVDVLINDNGTEYNCELVAGHDHIAIPDEFTVQPSVGWSLQIKAKAPPRKRYPF
jgi:hypothetical protein